MTDTFNSKFCGTIQKLSTLNCLQWSSSMIQHFASTEINVIVQGQRSCPPAGSEEREISSWKRDDSRAKGALLGACTPAMRAHIESVETSAEMWIILSKCANSADTIKGRQNLASKFCTIKATTGEPLSDYFGRLTEIRDLLKGTDHKIVEWIYLNPFNQQTHPPPPKRHYTHEEDSPLKRHNTQHKENEDTGTIEDVDEAPSDQQHTVIGIATPAENQGIKLPSAQRTKQQLVLAVEI